MTEMIQKKLQAAQEAKLFDHAVNSNYTRILIYIDFIELYDNQTASVLAELDELADTNEGTRFVKQIRLIESYHGAGFLSVVSLMAEIGDFSAFKNYLLTFLSWTYLRK